jgi:hypothetical protein
MPVRGLFSAPEHAGKIVKDSGLVMMDAKTVQDYHQQAYGVMLNATQAFHLARSNTASYLNITEDQVTAWETAAGVNPELGRAAQVKAAEVITPLAKTIDPETQARCEAVAAANMPALLALGEALKKAAEVKPEEAGASRGKVPAESIAKPAGAAR